MLVNIPFPNLVSGVSQQAPSMRLPSQANEQVNCVSSLIEGLVKRPPTRNVGKAVGLSTAALDKSAFHVINRDSSERYTVVVRGDIDALDADESPLVVMGIDGTEYPVVYDKNAREYLNCLDPGRDLRMLTVADYTFIVNRTKTVAMEPETTPNPEKQAMVVVVSGHAASDYVVDLQATTDGQPVGGIFRMSYTTGGTTDPMSWRTNRISAALFGSLPSNSGFSARARGHVIRIRRSSSGGQPPLPRDFNITVSDSQGGRSLKVVKDVVDDITDLPKFAFTTLPPVKVVPEDDVSELGYYLKFVSPNTTADTAQEAVNGYWEETAAPGIPYKFNLATMPHTLVREFDENGDIRFRLKQGEWESRSVGDEDSSPDPSIVGTQITDMFFFKNRLGLLGKYDKVVLSEAGYYFNLWRTTCITVPDSDPVDVAVAHDRVSEIRAAIPYNERLVLFSDLTQFSMQANAEVFSPSTVSVTQTTEYEADLMARPVNTGSTILFAQRNGAFSKIQEYVQNPSVDSAFDAIDITSNCSAYLRGRVRDIEVSNTSNTAVVVTDDPDASLYVYRFFINGNEKIQSSWSRWEFPEASKVIGAGWIDTDLYMLVRRPDGLFVESMRVQEGEKDPLLDYTVHLDRRAYAPRIGRTYSTPTNRTTLVLPYDCDPAKLLLVNEGAVVPFRDEGVNGDGVRVVSVEGSLMTAPTLYAGIPYHMRYEFGTPFVRNDSNRTINAGRFTLTYGRVVYDASAHFEVVVSPRNRSSYRYTFTPSGLGYTDSDQGVVLSDGVLSFPIHARNTEVTISIENDTYLPCRLMSAEIEGNYVARSRS